MVEGWEERAFAWRADSLSRSPCRTLRYTDKARPMADLRLGLGSPFGVSLGRLQVLAQFLSRATPTVARRIPLNAPSLPQGPGLRGVETDSSRKLATAALASPSPRAITSARRFFDPAYQGRTNLYVVVNS
jgi:hypothetical protein